MSYISNTYNNYSGSHSNGVKNIKPKLGKKNNVFAAGTSIITHNNFEIKDTAGKYNTPENSLFLSNIVRKKTSLEKTFKSNCYLSNNNNCVVSKKKFNNYDSAGTRTTMLRLLAKNN